MVYARLSRKAHEMSLMTNTASEIRARLAELEKWQVKQICEKKSFRRSRDASHDGLIRGVVVGPNVLAYPVSPSRRDCKIPKEIRDQILKAARYIPVEQLGTPGDCGFSPCCDDTSLTRENTFAKIGSLAE